MKKILFIILIAISLLTTIFLIVNKYNSNDKTTTYSLNNKQYKLLIADEPKEWEKGLMFYRKPVKFDGMIFLFPDKKTRTFWNKNTYLDLDVYWLNADRIIGKNHLPSIQKTKNIMIVSSFKKVDRVIELITNN